MRLKTKDQLGSLKTAGFYVPAVLIVVFILLFSIVFFKTLLGEKTEITPTPQTCSNNENKTADGNVNAGNIKVTTNKKTYLSNEKISLHIENLGENPVYSEPCKDIKVFEKKENDSWVLKQGEDIVVAYQETNFEKKEGNTECDVDIPQFGPGTYRVIVPIYFGCTKPSHYACKGSEIFRSNEFELQVLTDTGSQK